MRLGIRNPRPSERELNVVERRQLTSTMSCPICERAFSFMNHHKDLDCGHRFCEPCYKNLPERRRSGKLVRICLGCEKDKEFEKGVYAMTTAQPTWVAGQRKTRVKSAGPHYMKGVGMNYTNGAGLNFTNGASEVPEIFEQKTTTRLISLDPKPYAHGGKIAGVPRAGGYMPMVDSEFSSVSTSSRTDSTWDETNKVMDIRPHESESRIRSNVFVVKSFQLPHTAHSLALLGLDSLVTCDRKERSVDVFDCAGQRKRRLRGYDWHKLRNPIYVATDGDGRIAICDLPPTSTEGRLLFYGIDGKLMGQFARSKVRHPLSVDLSSDKISGDSYVLASDRETKQVFIEKPDGVSVLILAPRPGGKFGAPAYVRFLGKDTVAVSDLELHAVFIYDISGRMKFFVGRPGEPGDGLAHLSKPRGVCETSDGFLIADRGNDRIVHVSKEGRVLGDFLTHRDGVVSPYDMTFNKWGELAVSCVAKDTPYVRVFSFTDSTGY